MKTLNFDFCIMDFNRLSLHFKQKAENENFWFLSCSTTEFLNFSLYDFVMDVDFKRKMNADFIVYLVFELLI